MCAVVVVLFFYFFFQAEDGIRYYKVTGIQTCALPISGGFGRRRPPSGGGVVGDAGCVVVGAGASLDGSGCTLTSGGSSSGMTSCPPGGPFGSWPSARIAPSAASPTASTSEITATGRRMASAASRRAPGGAVCAVLSSVGANAIAHSVRQTASVTPACFGVTGRLRSASSRGARSGSSSVARSGGSSSAAMSEPEVDERRDAVRAQRRNGEQHDRQ